MWNILELYSGIGGMHFSFEASACEGKIVAAIEICPTAIHTYRLNFPHSKVFNSNLDNLKADFVRKLDVNCILMSPPCQPFTRNGLKKDIRDPRTRSFRNILGILSELEGIRCVLIENVVGFESSEMAEILLSTLDKCNFYYEQYHLNPVQFGIPNSRNRYYCLAKRCESLNSYRVSSKFLSDRLRNVTNSEPCRLETVIETAANDVEVYKVPDRVLLRYLNTFDICTRESRRSCCFTKSYRHYAETTGSVYTPLSRTECTTVLQSLVNLDPGDYLVTARTLKLRYFSEFEVAKLLGFPCHFRFPDTVSLKQRYQLLGNSLNVRVVSLLIQRLFEL